jgi:hypothetical protein
VKGVNRKWTDNTMGKRKKTGQTIQWGNEKRQDRQYNGETKKDKWTNVCFWLVHPQILF